MTINCPICGREIERSAIPRSGFPCPWCNGRLRLEGFGGREHVAAVLVGACFAFLIPYLLGAGGFGILLFGALLYIPVCGALGGLRVLVFPLKLKTDYSSPAVQAEPVGNILHITGHDDRDMKGN